MDKEEIEAIKAEFPQFYQQGLEFLDKKISVIDFKALSGKMGVYAQRGGQRFMIRLRIHAGVLSLEQLERIYAYTQKYGLNWVHLTTRQTIQLHNLRWDDLYELMKDALENDLFSRGGGGNYPRNVALSPLSGVEQEEAFDVSFYALQTEEYFMKQITSYHLPRKFKAAFSSSDCDLANASCNDLGFIARLQDGKPYFQMLLAGGIGKEPKIGILYPEKVRPEEILYYIEAMVQLFLAEGDFKNHHQARIRFIRKRMGEEGFLACYEKHLEQVKESRGNKLLLKEEQAEQPEKLSDSSDSFLEEKEFQSFAYLIAQKQKGHYTVVLHPPFGKMETEDIKTLLSFLKDVKTPSVRLSMEQELYIRNLTAAQAKQLAGILPHLCYETQIERSVTCIGIPICQIGFQNSQKLLKEILSYLKQRNIEAASLPRISISGCPNSCARHPVAELGFAGTRKRVDGALKDCFELFAGGRIQLGNSQLARSWGIIEAEKIPELIGTIAILLKEKNRTFSDFIKSEYWEEIIKNYKIK